MKKQYIYAKVKYNRLEELCEVVNTAFKLWADKCDISDEIQT